MPSSDRGFDPSAEVISDSLDPTASQALADVFLGPCAVGWILAIFGCGVSVSNLLSYSQTSLYRNDPRRTQWSLWILTAFTLGSAGLNAAQIWHYTVTQRRSFEILADFQIIDCLPALPQGCAQAIAQTLLAERAMHLISPGRRLTKAIWFLYLLIGSCLLFSCLDVTTCYLERADLGHVIRPFTYDIVDVVWYCLAASIDIIIAVVLVANFCNKWKHSQGAPAATDVLRQLIALSVFTASLTALFAFGAAIGSLLAEAGVSVDGLDLDFTIAFAAVLPSLYSLSLITTLRARKRLRARLTRDCAPAAGDWLAHDLPPFTTVVASTDPTAQKVERRRGREGEATEGDEEHQEAHGQAPVVHVRLGASSGSESTSAIGEKPASSQQEGIV